MVVPWSIKRNCSVEFKASHHSGPRSGEHIAYLVIHVTQESVRDATKRLSARNVARYFAGKSSGGSTQLVVSDLDCYQTLSDLVIPWGAPPLNTSGVHIEICGRVEWSRKRWLLHYLAIRRAAYKSAIRCKRWRIPPRLLDEGDLRRIGSNPPSGKGGVTTHVAISRAFGQTNHGDPGIGFPMDIFLRLLRGFLSPP